MLLRLFLLFDALLMKLPRSWRKSLFIALGSIAHSLAPKRNRIIQQNLDLAFQNTLSADEKKEIERYCYRNLALNLLQTMENRRNTIDDLKKHVTFANREVVDALLAEGKGVVFVAAHYGNWELGGVAISALLTPIASIYKGFSRKEFDPYLHEARTRHHISLAEKTGALKLMAKTLKNNGSIMIMMDQSASPRYGVVADFMGHSAYHSAAAANLAFKFNRPIVGAKIQSDDEEHYTITFEKPIYVEGEGPEAILEATKKQVADLERLIKEEPKYWFWCHKRWKGKYLNIYQ